MSKRVSILKLNLSVIYIDAVNFPLYAALSSVYYNTQIRLLCVCKA